jgi:TorA maturation chaperone TorD
LKTFSASFAINEFMSDNADRAGHQPFDKTADDLRAGAAVLFWLSDVYLNAPRSEAIEALRLGSPLDFWPLDRSHPDTIAGLERLELFLADWSPDRMSVLEADYTRLFIGVERTLAPPYESVYLSEEHILFEKETAAVRKWYAKYGLQVPQLHISPDDHIGYELFFLARLENRVASLLDSGETEAAVAVRNDSHRFVDAHLNRWVGLFVSRVLEHSQTDFYAAIGLLTRSVVEQGR